MDKCTEEMLEIQQGEQLYEIGRSMRFLFGREDDALLPRDMVEVVADLCDEGRDPASPRRMH